MITNAQKNYIAYLREELKKLDENNKLLKENFEKMNKQEASKYIDNLLIEIRKLQLIFETRIKIKCKKCGYIVNFIGSEEIAKKYWICSCGSIDFEVIK